MLCYAIKLNDLYSFRFRDRLGAAINWPKVDADAGVEMGKQNGTQELEQEEEDADAESDVDAQGRKKSRKEKIGFRDRKVM